MSLLDDYPLIAKIRRNHGLEHATVHILNLHYQRPLSLIAHSDWNGFTIYGQVDTAEVRQAAHEALRRLRQGESNLAVHPRCGTVLVTIGVLTALATFLAISLENSSRKRFPWSSIPGAVLAATAAAILSQPLGLLLQERFTVSGQPDKLEIKNVSRKSRLGLVMHRVDTA